jgi:hypothetical protein
MKLVKLIAGVAIGYGMVQFLTTTSAGPLVEKFRWLKDNSLSWNYNSIRAEPKLWYTHACREVRGWKEGIRDSIFAVRTDKYVAQRKNENYISNHKVYHKILTQAKKTYRAAGEEGWPVTFRGILYERDELEKEIERLHKRGSRNEVAAGKSQDHIDSSERNIKIEEKQLEELNDLHWNLQFGKQLAQGRGAMVDLRSFENQALEFEAINHTLQNEIDQVANLNYGLRESSKKDFEAIMREE